MSSSSQKFDPLKWMTPNFVRRTRKRLFPEHNMTFYYAYMMNYTALGIILYIPTRGFFDIFWLTLHIFGWFILWGSYCIKALSGINDSSFALRFVVFYLGTAYTVLGLANIILGCIFWELSYLTDYRNMALSLFGVMLFLIVDPYDNDDINRGIKDKVFSKISALAKNLKPTHIPIPVPVRG